jgi:hypothetical protein
VGVHAFWCACVLVSLLTFASTCSTPADPRSADAASLHLRVAVFSVRVQECVVNLILLFLCAVDANTWLGGFVLCSLTHIV